MEEITVQDWGKKRGPVKLRNAQVLYTLLLLDQLFFTQKNFITLMIHILIRLVPTYYETFDSNVTFDLCLFDTQLTANGVISDRGAAVRSVVGRVSKHVIELS